MKAILGAGVYHKEERLIKCTHRLAFEKGGNWKAYEIAFDREWLEKVGAIKLHANTKVATTITLPVI